MRATDAGRHLTAHQKIARLIGQRSDLYVQQSDVNMLSLLRATAMNQCRQNRIGRIQARQNINHCHAHFLRGTIGLAGDTHQTTHGLYQRVIARSLGIRPVLPKTRD